jgi:hypothetical protein
METNDNLDEVFDDVVYENNAQEVFKKLYDLDNLKDRLISRWVWELIQNARGTADSQNQLQIEVVLENERLMFRHNGAPFKDREIAHLIFHGSSKHDLKDIGKFGSGFITTHLISRRVRVRGSLDDGRHFDFVLNREGNDAVQLLQAMEASKLEFLASVGKTPKSVPHPFTTEYAYPLSDAIREIVLQGIQALRRSAAYIFAFNPMLQRLKISTPTDTVDLTLRNLNEPLLPDARCLTLRADNKDVSQSLVVISSGGVEVAMAINLSDGQSAIELPSGIPRLFVAFPLNNTENFGVPLVLNSELFAPQEGRDGIYLGTSENETNVSNQALFMTGLQNIVDLISKAAQNNWSKVADVTVVPAFVTPSWAKEAWLRSQLRDVLVEGFRNQPLLRTVSGKFITPRSAWIPVTQNGASSSELWRVTEKLNVAADLLPRSQDQEAWGQSLQSWLPFLKDKEPHPKEIWSVEKLAVLLESLRKVTTVSAALQNDADAISWINEVHALIMQAGCFDLFRQRALIPNENGNFVQLSTLHLDSKVDEGLKDIAEQLGFPIRATLIHPGITSNEVHKALSAYTEATLVSKTLDLVRTRFPEQPLPDDVRNASVKFFGWLLTRGQTVYLDNYPVLSQVEPAKKVMFRLQLRANSTDNQRWLAPIELWPAQAREFSELFSDSVILHPDYAKTCSNPELWKKLESNGYLHLGPIIETESKVTDFLPDEPLPPDEEKSKPNSETLQPRSQIPFFSGDDHFVLNRARGSETRAIKVLKFLFDFILPADTRAFEVVTTKCDNGKDHRFYRAGWLTSLRNRWVPVGQGRSEPSAQSMASLLGKEPELLKRLSDQRVSQVFSIMGVSPADLLLRTVGRDDPERMILIQALSQISNAVHNDAERVKALAGAIEQDPEVLVFAEQRQQRRETVKRNQALGALVEDLFKQAFQGTGLVACRTGPGHDYLVTEGEEEDAGRIEIDSPIGKVFVEIKATTTNMARMSVKQVGEAVSNQERYFLCVAAVPDSNLNVDSFKARAKFVLNIGHLFQNLWREYVAMQNAVSKTPKYESGLAIELTDQQAKFRVDEEVWQTGMNFDNVIAEFKSRITDMV